MELNNSQKNAVALAVKRYKEKKPCTIIAGYAGVGKAQPNSTPIPTPNGTKLLSDITIGDYVYDRSGKPTKVIGVYPQGMQMCYTVTLADGRSTKCNDQHLFSYYSFDGELQTVSVRYMLDTGLFNMIGNMNVPVFLIPTSPFDKCNSTSIPIVDIKCNYFYEEMTCIYVDNPEHLYLTNDYIVTHNTTIVRYIVQELNLKKNDVVYTAYTGKAVSVLKNKGCENAITLHKLLYKSEDNGDGTFSHIPLSKLKEDYKLIVADEASMIPQDMIDLLLSHHIHVLFLGDQGQLKPIEGNQTLLEQPDIFLSEIVRQAADNPIIQMSMKIRNNQNISYGGNKYCRVIKRSQVSDKLLLGADQILCGLNKTRKDLNDYIRHIKYKDKYTPEPQNGDRVICLKNNWDLKDGLVNGQIGVLQNIKKKQIKPYGTVIIADFLSDDGLVYDNIMIDYSLLTHGEKTINQSNWKKFAKRNKLNEFDYGYVLTVNKAQGSEFDRVLVFDEPFGDTDERRRWRYTAVTRASKQLIYAV